MGTPGEQVTSAYFRNMGIAQDRKCLEKGNLDEQME